MKEFNDIIAALERIADSMDRIANAHGMAVLQPAATTAAAPEPQTAGSPEPAPKKAGRPKKDVAPAPAIAEAPAIVVEEKPAPVVEDLFGGDEDAPAVYTADDVKDMLTLALKNMAQDEVARIFKANNGGVGRVSDMDPKFYGPVVELFKTTLENLAG